MTNDPSRDQQHNSPSNLGWPLVTMVLGLLASVTVISATGNDIAGLLDVIKTIGSVVAAAGGVGAWVNSTRAARQTNGALDKRMDDAVRRGVTLAVVEARRGQKKAPAAHAKPPAPR